MSRRYNGRSDEEEAERQPKLTPEFAFRQLRLALLLFVVLFFVTSCILLNAK